MQIASATWSTWIGGIVIVFAMDTNGEGGTWVVVGCGGGNADPRARRMPAGVGNPLGALAWMVAERS